MSKLLKCLVNKDNSCVPVWFMRQAGRYLPEFRELRSQNKNFLELCFNSKLTTEITLQPLKRFNLDAAIIFSDILVIPHALKQTIEFREIGGPYCTNLDINKLLNTENKDFLTTLDPIYKAIKQTKKLIKKSKSLIGFVGAPWTLIIYLYNLKEKKDLSNKITISNKKEIKTVLKKLEEVLKLHIMQQKKAGVEVVQIFDSWAGLIKEDDLEEYCFTPNKNLVNFCREIAIPSICFPKGLKSNYKKFVEKVKPDAINIDQKVDPRWAKTNLSNVCIQGGMDPELLLGNEKKVLEETERYLEIFKNNLYIFNLGHGILPETNPNIVKKIVDKVNLVTK